MEAIIIKNISDLYTVMDDTGCYDCKAKGVFRNKNITPTVGDKVLFDKEQKVITKILDRKNILVRPPVANIDIAIIVMSVANPEFSTNLVDKLINIIKRIFNYYVFFAFILVDLAIMIYLILKEKLCSLPWLCAVNVVISFVVYKVGEVIANYHISDYFSIKSTFEKCVEPCYISLFLFGILCLIIYLIFKLKKWLVMAKVKYDDKVYWRE